jgi:hypothetical protein
MNRRLNLSLAPGAVLALGACGGSDAAVAEAAQVDRRC